MGRVVVVVTRARLLSPYPLVVRASSAPAELPCPPAGGSNLACLALLVAALESPCRADGDLIELNLCTTTAVGTPWLTGVSQRRTGSERSALCPRGCARLARALSFKRPRGAVCNDEWAAVTEQAPEARSHAQGKPVVRPTTVSARPRRPRLTGHPPVALAARVRAVDAESLTQPPSCALFRARARLRPPASQCLPLCSAATRCATATWSSSRV